MTQFCFEPVRCGTGAEECGQSCHPLAQMPYCIQKVFYTPQAAAGLFPAAYSRTRSMRNRQLLKNPCSQLHLQYFWSSSRYCIASATCTVEIILSPARSAIVLETFGIGGIPDYEDTAFENAIFNWVDSGKTIVVTTQVPEEGCDFTVYQVGKKYNNRPGIMTAGDMTTEAIVAKLMWVLGQTNERKQIEKLFNKIINNDHQEEY